MQMQYVSEVFYVVFISWVGRSVFLPSLTEVCFSIGWGKSISYRT